MEERERGMSFTEWFSKVDSILRAIGYNYKELCPTSWKNLYDDNYTPFKAVSESEFDGKLTWSLYYKLRIKNENKY